MRSTFKSIRVKHPKWYCTPDFINNLLPQSAEDRLIGM